MATVAEAITVTATTPTVLETPQVAATITQKQVEALPIQRSPLAAALLQPGINELRLKEQASRLAFDQFSVQLREAGLDDEGMAALAEALQQGQKTSQAEITRLAALLPGVPVPVQAQIEVNFRMM